MMLQNFKTIIKKQPKLQYVLSFILGLFLVFAYAPYHLWPIAIIVPTLWLTIISEKTTAVATKLGFFLGLGWFSAGISWVHVSIVSFGGVPLAISMLLMLLLCSYLALYPAIACYLCCKFSNQQRFNAWLLPPIWLVSEYLRGIVLTGFPWLSLGYSQIDGPFSVLAPITGEIGITLVMLILSVCFSKLLLKQNINSHILIVLIIFFLTWTLSKTSWVASQHKHIKVALVQGNIKQEMRWQPESEWPTMKKYLNLTQKNFDADIIVWPESAIPKLEPLAQKFLGYVNNEAAAHNSAIITGIQNYNIETKQYFNGLIVLGKKNINAKKGEYFYQTTNRYYKHHLLPIGEFVPFGDLLRPLAPLFNLPMSSFSRGSYVQPNIVANGLHILPLICFEIVFSKQLKANFHNNTDLLLTVSNDAWFGDSNEPSQHLEITRMRALEYGRPTLRTTNNGITAAIDYQGNIIAQIPQFTTDVLRAKINLMTGRTPYSQWGNWFSYLLALILFISIQIKVRR